MFKTFKEEDPDFRNCLPLFELESDYIQQIKTAGPLTEIKLVNTRIKLLITMIMKILKDTNPEKYNKIIDLLNNTNEITNCLNARKIRDLFEKCEKSLVLTDLKCYKILDKNDFLTEQQDIRKLILPKKCLEVEMFIGHIRSVLLQEIKIFCQKHDSFKIFFETDIEKNKFYKRGELESKDSVINKVEFFEKSDISIYSNEWVDDNSYPTEHVTNMTVYKLNNFNESMLGKITQSKGITKNSNTKKDQTRMSILLNNMSNSQRIRVGNKVAKIKSKRVSQGLVEKKVPIDGVIQEVLSKKSLENLILACFGEERETFLKPLENKYSSDFGFKFKIDDHQLISHNSTHETQNSLQNVSSSDLQENNSSFIYETIKQDLITKETNKRIKLFLKK